MTLRTEKIIIALEALSIGQNQLHHVGEKWIEKYWLRYHMYLNLKEENMKEGIFCIRQYPEYNC